MKSTLYLIMFIIIIISTSSMTVAKDNIIKLEGIKIKANSEAPQVMYIIPWQNPEGAERLYTPVSGTEIERLKPLDPYTFDLEIGLHKQWKNSGKTDTSLVSD
jgi:hypothetical protein